MTMGECVIVLPTLDLIFENTTRRKWNGPLVDYGDWTPEVEKNGQFPDEPVRIKDEQIHYVTSQTY